MADKDFSEVTWREFWASKQNKPNWHARVEQNKRELLKHPSEGVYSFLGDEFEAPDTEGQREVVLKYAIYRNLVLDDGGTPSPFEDPYEF